jgi:hypothetical protein
VISTGTAFNFLNTLLANLNIATNGGAGQTIRVGAYTGASIHCANIDHQGNSINHATNASGGTLNLCNNMTSGTLNIGTNTARSGNVNIGNGVGATGSVLIGSSTSPTTVGGTLTSTGQITASGGLSSTSGLTLASSYTPTSSQLGYNLYNLSNVGATLSGTVQTIYTFTNIPIGIYIFTHSATLYSFTIGATQVATLQIAVTGGITAPTGSLWPKAVVSGVATTFQTSPTIGGIVRFTSAINTLTFDIQITAGGGTCICSNFGYYAVRIA